MKNKEIYLIVFAIGIAIGYNYCVDLLQAEETQLKHHPYFLTSQQFNFLYFFTYLGQFLFLVPLGILVDVVPLKLIMMIIIVVTICAQTILGILLDQRGDHFLIFMYITRGVLGVCGLGIITIQGKLVNKFSKKHYEYIMGLCLNVPYLFNAINSFITSAVQSQTDNMPLCFYIGTIFCLFSLIFGILIILRFLNSDNEDTDSSNLALQTQNQGFSFNTLKNLKVQFWVIILSIFFTEGSINPMIDNLSDYIAKSFGIKEETVGMLVPILFIFLTPFSIILGKVVQHFPSQKRNLMIASRLIYMIALIILLQTPQTDTPSNFYYIAIVAFLLIMSFNWAVFHSVLEPGLAAFVKPSQLGTALGIMGATIGLCQSIFSLMNIFVTSSSKSLLKSYSKLILYYILIAGVSVLLAIWIRVRDYQILDKHEEHNERESKFAKLEIEQ